MALTVANVKYSTYGAVGDGVTNDTAAIQRAIDDLSAQRGGVVYLPAGAYKVTTLTMKSGVNLYGVGNRQPFPALAATSIHGTAGSDILSFPEGTFNVDIRDLTFFEGRRQVSSLGQNTIHVQFENVNFGGPSDAGVYVEGSIERWRWRHCIFTGGDFGYRHANVQVAGSNYLDKSTFIDCIWSGQLVNAVRIEVELGNSITFVNPIFNTTGQHGVYLDGGIRGLTFINANTEGNGQSGLNNRTTLSGTVSTGATSATMASATGWATSGTSITIQGAATDGNDHQGGAWLRSGTTLTWSHTTSNTVSNPKITDAVWDDFHLANGVATLGEVTFLGGLIGGEGTNGKLRYAIDNSVGATIYLFGVGAIAVPVYDPFLRVAGLGSETSIRQPPAGVWTNKSVLGSAAFTSFQTGNTRNWAASPAGGALVLFLQDSNLAGTGTWDKLEVRVHDPNRTRLFHVDGTSFDVVQEQATGKLTVKGALDHDGTTAGFYGVTPATRPTAYTQTYSTADKTLAAYTADVENVAYTGAADSEAKLLDLNALRVAYETLRVFTEDLAQQHNSLLDDLQALGLIQ